MGTKTTIAVRTVIVIACVLAVMGIFLESMKRDAEKAPKPTRGVTFEEAQIYAAGFEAGYNRATADIYCDIMDVAIDAEEDVGQALLENLVKKVKEIKAKSKLDK